MTSRKDYYTPCERCDELEKFLRKFPKLLHKARGVEVYHIDELKGDKPILVGNSIFLFSEIFDFSDERFFQDTLEQMGMITRSEEMLLVKPVYIDKDYFFYVYGGPYGYDTLQLCMTQKFYDIWEFMVTFRRKYPNEQI